MRFITWLDTVGNALIMQLLFVLFPLPIVTAVPAAVALQRQFRDLCQGQKTGIRAYSREFASAWRATWMAAIIAPVVVAGLAVGIPFWYSVDTWFSKASLVVLVGLAGLALAFWLAFLWASEADRAGDWSAWRVLALKSLLTRSGWLLWALILLVTWLALGWFIQPMLLVGSGLVPAGIVYWTLSVSQTIPASTGQASRS